MPKKNKDLYIFLASVVLLIVVSVTIISALQIIKMYMTPKEILTEKDQGKGIKINYTERPKDPLIIPAPK